MLFKRTNVDTSKIFFLFLFLFLYFFSISAKGDYSNELMSGTKIIFHHWNVEKSKVTGYSNFLYEKINGYSMFSDKGKDKDQISLFKKIVTWKLPKKQRLVEHLKDEYADAADLILQLTKVREAERLGSGRGAQAIKQHPFFKDVDFVALRLRKYQPESAIWVPDFDKKDPTKHFRKKLRYTPPKEYTGDETWCAHW